MYRLLVLSLNKLVNTSSHTFMSLCLKFWKILKLKLLKDTITTHTHTHIYKGKNLERAIFLTEAENRRIHEITSPGISQKPAFNVNPPPLPRNYMILQYAEIYIFQGRVDKDEGDDKCKPLTFWCISSAYYTV